MIRKLFAVAVLVAVAAFSTPRPAPAIDFACTCFVCHNGTGPACRDPRLGLGANCATWWAIHSSECQ